MATNIVFAIPGLLETRSGGYIYDRRVMAELEAMGVGVAHLPLGPGFPLPSAGERALAARRFAALPTGTRVLVDGLAFGALPEVMEEQARRLRLIALVHHPLALETGLPEAQRAQLRTSERRALAQARAVVATSRSTAATLAAEYGVPREAISVARPGTEPVTRMAEPSQDGVARILSVGAVVPRKGYDVLVAALSRIADLDWSCAIVGSLDRSPATEAGLRAQVAELGLNGRVFLLGEVEDPADYYEQADLFVSASHHEGYGMAIAEALRHGLPVIATRAGAVPELVPPGAGVLVPPGEDLALAIPLRRLVADPAERMLLSAGALAASAPLPRWHDTARRVLEAIREVP